MTAATATATTTAMPTTAVTVTTTATKTATATTTATAGTTATATATATATTATAGQRPMRPRRLLLQLRRRLSDDCNCGDDCNDDCDDCDGLTTTAMRLPIATLLLLIHTITITKKCAAIIVHHALQLWFIMYCNYRISCTTIIVYHEPQLEHICTTIIENHELQLDHIMYYNYSTQCEILIAYVVQGVHLCNICDIFDNADDVQYL